LQGSVVPQTVLDGLTIDHQLANFLQSIVYVSKVMKVGWQYRQSYCNIIRLTFWITLSF